ncbi:MAG: hypothetical protein E6G44_07565 [Actinobacteria bacterium]|nr:MAG: hypothetical protein E6G44_07565 [Actinomycetota bacterium]
MPAGELIFANVLDVRQRAAEGDMADGLVYLLSLPARALPFTVVRDWKAPTGYLQEEVQLLSPSGRVVYRIGPSVRHLLGSMDLTRFEDVADDAVFEEVGTYLASFLLAGELVGQTEFQVVVQAPADKLPKEVDDGLKKSDVAWIGVEYEGRDVAIPAWFVYRNGKIFVLSSKEPSLEEQSIPGLPDARDLVVITRRKYRDTALGRFHAATRLLEGGEWEDAAKLLADRRRDRHGPPEDAIKRWRGTCAIVELTPIVA